MSSAEKLPYLQKFQPSKMKSLHTVDLDEEIKNAKSMYDSLKYKNMLLIQLSDCKKTLDKFLIDKVKINLRLIKCPSLGYSEGMQERIKNS